MESVEQIKEEIVKKDKRSVLTFLVFVVISAVLWFLIKLTKDYSTQTVFQVRYTEAPVNKWISTPEQNVKVNFVADGFVTLGLHLIRQPHRYVEIPLDEVPYRLEGGFTYSYSSQYVAEKVAEWLGIPASSVTLNDDKQFFNMEDLQSKEVPVKLRFDIQPQRQFRVYGEPKVVPSRVTVYGPKNTLDTLSVIHTECLSSQGAEEDFDRMLNLDFYGGAIRSETGAVEVHVDLERFTEMDIEVPVTLTDTMSVRFFPETMSVKCMVAIKDYGSITPASFKVVADTAQLHQLLPLLDLHLVTVPSHVKVMRTSPDKVEYLIVD